MSVGSLLGALGLVLIVLADHPRVSRGVDAARCRHRRLALRSGLRHARTHLRRGGAAADTALTLAGGFASTVSWPTTHVLLEAVGWRGTYLVYAGLLACVAAPLHAFALPRTRADPVAPAGGPVQVPTVVLPPKGWPFVLVAAAFAAYAFVPSGMSAHLLAIFGRAGIDAATVVAIGALFGPAQVAARICELIFARRTHPLNVARCAIGMLLAAFALLALFGLTVASAATFVIMFGMANGLITIARGAVPLTLLGQQAMDISWGGSGPRSWRCKRSRRWRSPSSRNGRPIRWCSQWSRASRPWLLSPSSRYVRPKRRVDLTRARRKEGCASDRRTRDWARRPRPDRNRYRRRRGRQYPDRRIHLCRCCRRVLRSAVAGAAAA